MSGIEADVMEGTMQGTDAVTPYHKPVVEVVFDTERTPGVSTVDPEAEEGTHARIRAGIAALQKAGKAAGRVPAAAAAPAEVAAEPAKDSGGVDADVVGAGKADEPSEVVENEPEAPAEGKDPAAEEPAEEDPAKKVAAPPPDADRAKLEADLVLAQARIDDLMAGSLPDDDRVGWVEKPVDWIKGQIARRMGVSADDPAVAKAMAHFQWELTLDSLGVENLPKDLRERNDTEHAERRKALAETTRGAQEAAKKHAEGRVAVHRLVHDRLAASADKFPYAALAAEINLGGVKAADAALYLWSEAVKAGTVKNTGNDDIDVPEALRLYDEFSKTRLAKLQPKNATPPPANTPAASKEAAPGASKPAPKTPPTLTSKQAAAAPQAKKAEPVTTQRDSIDASDPDAIMAQRLAIARKHFANK